MPSTDIDVEGYARTEARQILKEYTGLLNHLRAQRTMLLTHDVTNDVYTKMLPEIDACNDAEDVVEMLVRELDAVQSSNVQLHREVSKATEALDNLRAQFEAERVAAETSEARVVADDSYVRDLEGRVALLREDHRLAEAALVDGQGFGASPRLKLFGSPSQARDASMVGMEYSVDNAVADSSMGPEEYQKRANAIERLNEEADRVEERCRSLRGLVGLQMRKAAIVGFKSQVWDSPSSRLL